MRATAGAAETKVRRVKKPQFVGKAREFFYRPPEPVAVSCAQESGRDVDANDGGEQLDAGPREACGLASGPLVSAADENLVIRRDYAARLGLQARTARQHDSPERPAGSVRAGAFRGAAPYMWQHALRHPAALGRRHGRGPRGGPGKVLVVCAGAALGGAPRAVEASLGLGVVEQSACRTSRRIAPEATF